MLEMSWITAILQLYCQVTDLFGNVIVKRINIRLFDLLALCLYILNLPCKYLLWIFVMSQLSFSKCNIKSLSLAQGIIHIYMVVVKTSFFLQILVDYHTNNLRSNGHVNKQQQSS